MRPYANPLNSIKRFQEGLTAIRADYQAGEESRFVKFPKGVSPIGTSADYHTQNESNYFRMLEMCRYTAREDVVVGQGVRTLVRNVIQDGFGLKAATGDKNLDDNLEERWGKWGERADTCDHQGEWSWHWFEKLITAAIVVDGDVGIAPLTTGALQAFESQRLRSPSQPPGKRQRDITLGVERDANRRRIRYWITRNDFNGPFKRISAADMVAIDAFQADRQTARFEPNFFHCYLPWRLTQTRGISALAPVIPTARMHDDVQFAKLVQSQIVSYFAILHSVPEDAELYKPPGDVEPDPDHPDRNRETTPLAPGAEYWPQVAGETLSGFSPNVPNAEFFDHSKMLLTFIAVNLDLPLMLLLMDPSQTNFSGWRGAMDQAKLRFKDFQCSLASLLHAQVYRFKVRQWIAQDTELRSAYQIIGEDIFGHEWHFPKWPYIQPLDDIAADAMEVRTHQNSARRVLMRKGLEIEQVVSETIDDNKFAIDLACAAAKELNAKWPDALVDWREIYTVSPPENVQLALSQPQQPQETGATDATTRSSGSRTTANRR